MPDKKLTDSEIIKALEDAEYKVNGVVTQGFYLSVETFNAVVDLINRLQAENERLKENLNIELENYATEYDYKIKAEAYKEFAERLKNEIIGDTAYGCDTNQHTGYYDYQIKIGDIPEYIDNLLKEMECENNDR